MTNNDLPCNKCGGQHHPAECLKEELKSCPFKECGGEGQYILNSVWGHIVSCESCHKFVRGKTKYKAIKAWNTREGDKG